MARILVTPEQLQTIAAQFSQTANDIQSLASRVQGAANSLDWELKQKAGIDQQIADLNGKARLLGQQTLDLSAFLRNKGQEFTTADSQASSWFTNFGNEIFNSITTTFTNLGNSIWPLIASLPIIFRWTLPWKPPFILPPHKEPRIPDPPSKQPVKPITPPANQPVINPGLVKPNPNYDKWQQTGRGGYYPIYPEDGNWKGAGTLHPGIDIAPKAGGNKSVHPIGPGIVKTVSPEYTIDPKTNQPVLDAKGNPKKNAYGNSIVIEHTLSDGTTVYSRYAHLANLPNLKTNDIVDINTDIGTMGNTGNSDGAHLHLSIQHEYGGYESFYGHKPNELTNPKDPKSETWGQVMEKNFIDPTGILNGTLNMQFQNPPAKPQST